MTPITDRRPRRDSSHMRRAPPPRKAVLTNLAPTTDGAGVHHFLSSAGCHVARARVLNRGVAVASFRDARSASLASELDGHLLSGRPACILLLEADYRTACVRGLPNRTRQRDVVALFAPAGIVNLMRVYANPGSSSWLLDFDDEAGFERALSLEMSKVDVVVATDAPVPNANDTDPRKRGRETGWRRRSLSPSRSPRRSRSRSPERKRVDRGRPIDRAYGDERMRADDRYARPDDRYPPAGDRYHRPDDRMHGDRMHDDRDCDGRRDHPSTYADRRARREWSPEKDRYTRREASGSTFDRARRASPPATFDRPRHSERPRPLSENEQQQQTSNFLAAGVSPHLTVVLTNITFQASRDLALEEVHRALSHARVRVRFVHPLGRRCGACFVVFDDEESVRTALSWEEGITLYNRRVSVYPLDRPYTVRFSKLPTGIADEVVRADLRDDFGIVNLRASKVLSGHAYFEVEDFDTLARLLALDGYKHSNGGRLLSVNHVPPRGTARESGGFRQNGFAGRNSLGGGGGAGPGAMIDDPAEPSPTMQQQQHRASPPRQPSPMKHEPPPMIRHYVSPSLEERGPSPDWGGGGWTVTLEGLPEGARIEDVQSFLWQMRLPGAWFEVVNGRGVVSGTGEPEEARVLDGAVYREGEREFALWTRNVGGDGMGRGEDENG